MRRIYTLYENVEKSIKTHRHLGLLFYFKRNAC